MYGVGGERELPESTLDHLSGYEGARPVRIGNAAWEQRQHDVWGVFLDSVYLHTKSRDRLPERVWPILVEQVERAAENRRLPDRGIWEVRGEPKHFTSSKVFCWVALDRGARLARVHGNPELVERWSAIAAEIHADVCANGIDARVFTQHHGTTALDASLLLVPLLRFLPPDDELREPARAVRGGAGAPHGPAPGELPPGVHAPRADQRGRAPGPRRGARAARLLVATPDRDVRTEER
jgi:GH15 family glucan-1,4-alpha-glucosidase